MQWSNSLKKEHFIPLLYDVCKWETTYKVACFTLMLYLSSHKVLMDFIKWHTQYTHILDLCNWIKGHRARIMRRRVPVAGRARIMRRRLPVAGRAQQQEARSPNDVATFFRVYFTAMEWICTKCVMRSSAGKVADEKFRGEESCHEGLWISTSLRFAAARGGGGAREPAAVDITAATCSLLAMLAAFCLLLILPLMSWIINAKYMFI